MPLIFPHGFFPAKLSPAGTGGLLDNEANGFAASLDGDSAVVATSGTFPDLTEGWLMIGSWGIPGEAANAYIQKVMALPRRMSNFELEELTAS